MTRSVIRARPKSARTARSARQAESVFGGRLLIVKIVFLAAGLTIMGRLAFIQVVQQEAYQEMARMQQVSQVPIDAQRGLIYDRNLNLLALNEPCISVGLELRLVKNRRQYAEKLAPVLRESAAALLARMAGDRDFVWLKRQVDFEAAEKIKTLKLIGVRIEKDSRRRYPRGELAAHVLGYADIDNHGIAGIEMALDGAMRGHDGLQTLQRDALGNRLPDLEVPAVPPMNGKNVILTIDYILQTIAAEELRNSMEMFDASGGIVLIVNPMTGELLALDCEPGFDPNHPGAYSLESRRNRATADLYEPGSTFKLVTFAGILQEKLRTPDDIIFCENGRMKIYDHEIKDLKEFGRLRVREVIQHSSNIGAVKLAQILGPTKMYQYARDLGFGVASDLQLDGEVAGFLKHPVDWSGVTLPSMAMGYEVSVSALQMAMAYAVIANGGVLLEPQIVAGFVDVEGQPHRVVQPKVVRRVVSGDVARTMREMLEGVVEGGSGKQAAIEGVRIAGKTGTAHKPLRHGLGYARNDYNSSFIGFFPANDPRYLIFVLLENPRTSYWGGMVAAPTFRRIAQRVLSRQPREETRPEAPAAAVSFDSVQVPDFTNRPRAVVEEILQNVNVDADWEGDGDFVLNQEPAAGTIVPAGTKVILNLFQMSSSTAAQRLPSVVGLTAREAMRRLSRYGVQIIIQGSGRVRQQSPAAGTPVRPGIRCYLECQGQVTPVSHNQSMVLR